MMDTLTLKRIVDSLVTLYGEIGAKDYICAGDYSTELKTRAISLIDTRHNIKLENAMVIESDYCDVESTWRSESTWNNYHAS